VSCVGVGVSDNETYDNTNYIIFSNYYWYQRVGVRFVFVSVLEERNDRLPFLSTFVVVLMNFARSSII
jgi:hypothetical protein